MMRRWGGRRRRRRRGEERYGREGCGQGKMSPRLGDEGLAGSLTSQTVVHGRWDHGPEVVNVEGEGLNPFRG